MKLINAVHNFIEEPNPLWECEVTKILVQTKWNKLKKIQLSDPNEYSTARCVNNYSTPLSIRFSILNNINNETIYLEIPSNTLEDFYKEHGLYPCAQEEIESNAVLAKIRSAIDIIGLVKPAHSCIIKLVRAIQVLKQEDAEIDISYSHPKIPFSIFVSVCEDGSTLSSLRVAESILHEAMHLKLTLIENVLPLVKPFQGNLYFSPWRGEKRPASGILHALFVFRAIHNFYSEIKNNFCGNKEISKYLTHRLEDIKFEIDSLNNFANNQDLTESGKILASKLMKPLFSLGNQSQQRRTQIPLLSNL